ncbi:Nucleoside-diphosphate-sugar epimerase [Syntrophus gentianae]|uniref:Nucleoside-diphosphate-sugar epimerase n=1 Tax=Syntrophus gentianae TaxID=43775 RepID=A0A1H7WXH9_9BACT|nr:NAD-dependent epimerase/dehydratase family protein [Syntrophus gentianae]SEM25598.1 Nucleoside-diphosphate-sugar epimerase [Syntrophus gentianae]
MKKILVTGSTGQIGSELTPALRKAYGRDNVVAAGHSRQPDADLRQSGPYCILDVRDGDLLRQTVKNYRINTIFHLASILSAAAEEKPMLAWEINVGGLKNVLETAREYGCDVFFPSSIAVFGSGASWDNTPQMTIQRPGTLYGISKLTGELLCDYYHRRFGVDTRGLRFPGLLSTRTRPGGGTTDYAVEIFYAALEEGHYTCYLAPDTRLDMMYMPDALRAVMTLMEADDTRLIHRNAYNLTALNFTPAELALQIRSSLPGFSISYEIDPLRQAIADSWPRHMDDSAASTEWGWEPRYDLAATAADMLEKLAIKLGRTRENDHGTG